MQNLWNNLPETVKQALRSASVAIGLSLQNTFFVLVGAAITTGNFGSPVIFAKFCIASWWTLGIGPVIAALYRGRQGIQATKNTTTLGDGIKAVLLPSSGK